MFFKKIFPAILLYTAFVPAMAQISITGETAFHKAGYGTEFGILESTSSPDNGGLITCFVKNNNTVADSIENIKVSHNGVYDTAFYSFWWPLEIHAGAIGAVQLKGLSAPFREGDTVLLEVFTSKGFSASQLFINKTPLLRLANIIPSQDMKTLFIYLRNDGTTPQTVQEVKLNNDVFIPGSSVSLAAVGGSFSADTGKILILKLSYAGVINELTPINLRIKANGVYTSSFQRLVKAHFPIGTWNSSLFNTNKEEGRKLLRQLGITSVFGPGNFGLMQNAYNEYFMRVVHEPDFDSAGVFNANTGGQFVAARANEDVIHYWNVDDEPDLNGKDVRQEIAKNYAYWKNDTNTPSYVNLCTQKKYQRYGFFTDVVSMDHYSDDGPPNVIPFPWWYTTEGSVREAIEYTEQLKRNTEPKRMTSWCQLSANTWGSNHQAEDFIVNFQFWSHVSCGAKGIHYFVATPESKQDYPEQWNEAVHSIRQLNGIKNLCLYGEPWKQVKVNAGDVIASGLVSEDALVVVVQNNTIDYTPVNIINHDWVPSIQPVSFQIEFTVPDGFPVEQIYEAVELYKQNVASITNISGRTYRLNGTINTQSLTYVLGRNDTQAPQTVGGLNVSDKVSPNRFTLSWNEPHDNFGVKGYYIKADNDFIDTVFAPVWEAENKVNACGTGYWSVYAFDDAGNVSQPQVITIDWSSVGSGMPAVYQQPQNQTANAGSTATFTFSDSAATGMAYQWQADTGNGIWSNLQNGGNYSGVYSNTLSVFATQFNSGYRFRCAITVGCSQQTTVTDSASLTVNGSVNVAEITEETFTVYPNPAGDVLCIGNYTLKPGEEIRLYNAAGCLMLTGNTTAISIAALAQGVYTVVVNGKARKVVKM